MAEFVPGGRTVPADNGWKWLADAWKLFTRQPGTWLVLAVILLVLIGLIFIPGLGWLVRVVLIVLSPALTAGLMIGCRALDEGGTFKIGHLFAGFGERAAPLMVIGVLYLLALVAISLVVVLVVGFKLFSLLGSASPDPAVILGAATTLLLAVLIMLALLIPVAMALWFAPALVVFHQLGALEAMKASFSACLKNFLPFLVYGLILFIPSIVASIPFGLGWLVLGPVITASIYTAYRDIYFS